ncbi:hypothetical protein NL108_016651, partial [Boleophthalmus pectinirostris]
YDFSLERRSVRWGAELAEARAALARAEEVERAQRDADGPPGEEPTPGQTDAGDPPPPPPALNPVLASLSHNAILTPLPAPSLRPHSSQPAPALHSLDLADFEREEDPFDKLELKTIDDKEELKSILQNQPQPPPFSSPAEAPGVGGAGSRGNSPSPPAAVRPPKPAFAHKANGLVAMLEVGGGDDRPCNIRSLSFPKLSDSEHHVAPPPAARVPNGSPQRTPRGDVIMTPEPLSKSASPKPVSPTFTQHSLEMKGGENVCVCVPQVNSVGGGGGGGGGGLPCGGALLSMTPEERQCVETLVGMGYSYEGVLRAMQKQGQNVEQVLDYLFVHSRLCDRGFDASAVEECLEMYQCSEEK